MTKKKSHAYPRRGKEEYSEDSFWHNPYGSNPKNYIIDLLKNWIKNNVNWEISRGFIVNYAIYLRLETLNNIKMDIMQTICNDFELDQKYFKILIGDKVESTSGWRGYNLTLSYIPN